MYACLRRSLASIAALSLATTVPGCHALDFAPLTTARATLSEEFKTGPSPKIVIETFNGTIDISDGHDNEVVVEVTKTAGGFDQEKAEANLNFVEVSMVQKADTLYISARKLEDHVSNCGASVVISAPKAARVRAKSSNGRVICEGMQGGLEARTTNGHIVVSESRGAIDVATSNGGIEIDSQDAEVEARTSNGRISFRGSLAPKEQVFKSSNGRIDLALPADAQFRYECTTSNARIKCEFGGEDDDHSTRRRMRGKVGADPHTSITATTSNGGISIRKDEAIAKAE
jgi:DUF4097 and DUF4098 domain-containing protein YvlB